MLALNINNGRIKEIYEQIRYGWFRDGKDHLC